MKIYPIDPGCLGFDCDTKLTEETACQMNAAGYSFVVRYLSLTSDPEFDIDINEVNAIINCNLYLLLVQHVRYPGWSATEEYAKNDAKFALIQLADIGNPTGMTIYCDIESVANNPTDYINTWADIIRNAGYSPGVYIGANSQLSSTADLDNLRVDSYWKSMSYIPFEPTIGYSMIQTISSKMPAGFPIDEDTVQADANGNTPKGICK